MKMLKTLCVLMALSFISVGCYTTAINSEDLSNDAPILASAIESTDYEELDSETSVMYVPLFDVETGTYSDTESLEIRIAPDRYVSTNVHGGETKVEDIKYFPSTVAGITEHYDGYMIYLSASTYERLYNASASAAAGILGELLGGGIGAIVLGAVVSAIGSGLDSFEYYPNGVAYAVATSIYITRTITVPTPPIVIGEFYQVYSS